MCQKRSTVMALLAWTPPLAAVLFLSATSSATVNVVDTIHPIIFEPETDRGSLFGYSLALTKTKLYVGAPIHNVQGAVFQCEVGGEIKDGQERSCSEIKDDLDYNPTNNNGVPIYNRSNDNFLGASLAVSGGNGNGGHVLIACAPRAKSNFYGYYKGFTTGACFRKGSRDDDGAWKHIFDLPNLPKGDVDAVGWDVLDMMGHSISITDEEGDLILGAPVARPAWDVDVVRTTGHVLKVKKMRSGGYKIEVKNVEKSPWATKAQRGATKADPHKEDLAGTSFAVGRFYSSRKTDIAVGAPKANSLAGRVYLCKDCFWTKTASGRANTNWKLPKEQKSAVLEGGQTGSRFGHSVCAVNLNGRGLDEVVVGAPLFSGRRVPDIGAAYVYYFTQEGEDTESRLLFKKALHATKKESGARFGAAVANVGDVDGDGREDFAVAAPFEEQGGGAVYIFRGYEGFMRKGELPQRLSPKELGRPTLSGFGMSIYGGVDVDGYSQGDLAIGAPAGKGPASGKAVVLRTLDVAFLIPSTEIEVDPVGAIKLEDTEFTVTLRPRLSNGSRYSDGMVTYQVDFISDDDRIMKPSNVPTPPKVYYGATADAVVGPMTLKAKGTNFGSRPLKIEFVVTWALDNDSCEFPGCLIDPRNTEKGETVLKEQITVKKEIQTCKRKNQCDCNLALERVSPNPIKITMGTNKMEAKVLVANRGQEAAYDASLSITSDKRLPTPRDCEGGTTRGGGDQKQVEHSFKCKLPAIPKSGNKMFTIKFDKSDSDFPESAELAIELMETCAAQDDGAKLDLTLNLEFEYDYKISISSEEDKAEQKQYDQSDVPFRHVFKITNDGPSPQNKPVKLTAFVTDSELVTLTYNDPRGMKCEKRRISAVSSLPEHSQTSSGKLLSCRTEPCLSIECELPAFGLEPHESRLLTLDMNFRPEALSEKEIGDYSVKTFINNIINPASNKLAETTTEFYPKRVVTGGQAQPWHYAVGTVLGLLLLAALVVGLWKGGVFSRLRIFQKDAQEAQGQLQSTRASVRSSRRAHNSGHTQ